MLGPENPFGPLWSKEMTIPGVFPIKVENFDWTHSAMS